MFSVFRSKSTVADTESDTGSESLCKVRDSNEERPRSDSTLCGDYNGMLGMQNFAMDV